MLLEIIGSCVETRPMKRMYENSSRQSLLIPIYPYSTMTLRIISDWITQKVSATEKVMVARKQMIQNPKKTTFFSSKKPFITDSDMQRKILISSCGVILT